MDLGVLTVHLTGGEPLLYRDVLSVLTILVQGGVTPLLSTKAHLSPEVCRALAATGLREIQVSLDSPIPEVTDHLTGTDGSYYELIETIQNLRSVGIKVKINAVVTPLNAPHLPALVKLAHELDVFRVIFAPYSFSFGRHSESLSIWEDELRLLEEVHASHPGVDVGQDEVTRYEGFQPPRVPLREDPHTKQTQVVCSGGLFGLAIGPTGDVAICERMLKIPNGQGIVGNVVRQGGLKALWESDELRRFTEPALPLFEGTVCHGCPLFDQCQTTTGRCFVRTYASYGRLYAPDPLCPVSQESFVP